MVMGMMSACVMNILKVFLSLGALIFVDGT